MEALFEMMQQGLARLSLGDLALLSINTLFLLFSAPIFNHLDPAEKNGNVRRPHLHLFRAVNLLLLLLVLFSNFLPEQGGWISRSLAVCLVGYLAFLGYHLLDRMITKRFGKAKEQDGQVSYTDTYTSRVLSLIAAVFVVIVVLISVVRILGFESLLEAGGVIGFIGVLLALTQGAWAPDIISGLIILNSRLLEEGDVVEFRDGGETIFGIVFKTKVFHTELLDLADNHRIMIPNTRLRALTINNLSKFASARGLREELRFNIGYEVSESKVRALFQAVFDAAIKDSDIPIEPSHPPQTRAAEAGDYAILWSLFYHTKDVRNLLRTRQLLRALVIRLAAERGVSLATPLLHSSAGSGAD